MGKAADRLGVLVSFLVAAASAHAQIQQGFGNVTGQNEAQSLYSSGQQQSFLQNNSTNPSTSGVSVLQGDTTALQTYQGNPGGLQSDGQTALLTDPNAALALSTPSSNIASTDSWLQQSINVANNPQSQIQSSGSAQQQCTTTQTTQNVVSNDGTYTCETGQSVSDGQQVCSQTLQVQTQTTYNYTCTNTYNPQTQAFDPSSQCQALNQSGVCVQGQASCSGWFLATQCTAGVQWTSADNSCQTGTGWTTTNPTCAPQRNIVTGTHYEYYGNRNWNGVTWAPDAPETALQQAGTTCQVQGTNCTNTASPYVCAVGYTVGSYSTGLCFKQANLNAATWNSPGYHLHYNISANEAYTGTQTVAAFLAQDPVSAITGGNCQAELGYFGSGFAIINGMHCVQPFTPSAPTGSVYIPQAGETIWPVTNPTMAAAHFQVSPTTLYGYTYYSFLFIGLDGADTTCAANNAQGTAACSGGYTAGTGQIGATACISAQGGCTAALTQDGAYSYSCENKTPEPGCNVPQYFQQTASQCLATDPISHQCSATQYTYSSTAPGACLTWTDDWICTAQVPAAGTPVSTTPYLISDNWDNSCQTLSVQSGCSLTSSVVTQGPATRVINGLSVTEPSWALLNTYTCNVGNPVNTCQNESGCTELSNVCAQVDPNTGQCSLYNQTWQCWAQQAIDGCTGHTTGCTQTAQACAGYDRSGACSIWTYTYNCPASQGTPGAQCAQQTVSYACSADVPGADPFQSAVTNVTGTSWQPTACPQASNPNCASQGTSCTDGPSTKTVSGIQVTEPCWAQNTTYTCQTLGGQTNNCQVPSGCTFVNDTCLDNVAQGGTCVTTQHNYTCTTANTQTVTNSTCSSQLCVGAQCFNINGSSDNTGMAQAYSALASAQAAGVSYAQNLTVLGGNPLSCGETVLSYSNCCTQSGWGVGLGLSNCSTEEKTLAQEQKAKACHYVGTYCSGFSFFGICLSKRMVYCCFDGPLGRIINEAGRTQIGKGWGTAKNPDCSGFTVAQFQQLNLSNVDFSDFYSSTLANLAAPSTQTTVANIQSTLSNLYGGQAKTNLPSQGGLPTYNGSVGP